MRFLQIGTLEVSPGVSTLVLMDSWINARDVHKEKTPWMVSTLVLMDSWINAGYEYIRLKRVFEFQPLF